MELLKLRNLFISSMLCIICILLFSSCKTAEVSDIQYEETLGNFLLHTSLALEQVSSNYLFFSDERDAQVISAKEATRLLNEALENNLIIGDEHLTATFELLLSDDCIAVHIPELEVVDDSAESESDEKHVVSLLVIPSPTSAKTDIATFKNSSATVYKVKDNRSNSNDPPPPCWWGLEYEGEGCYCYYFNPGWEHCNDCTAVCKDDDENKILDMCKDNPNCGIEKFLDKNPITILKPNIWITPEFITPKI